MAAKKKAPKVPPHLEAAVEDVRAKREARCAARAEAAAKEAAKAKE